jgi:transposase
MIRATKHNLVRTNLEKRDSLNSLLNICRTVIESYVDYIWNNPILLKNGTYLDISGDKLNVPDYIDYSILPYFSISARLKSSLATQALGMVKSATVKRKNLLYGLSKQTEPKIIEKFNEKLKKTNLIKPSIPGNISIELSSKCAEFVPHESKEFTGFLVLKSLGYGNINKIAIPITKQKRIQSKYKDWKLKGSFLISKENVQLRWEKSFVGKIKNNTKLVGADTGFKTVVTLSDGQATPTEDIHGHSLESICKKMLRKKKGSKGYARAQDHRKNFINWSINQLNFLNLHTIALEKISNIFYKNKTSALMNRWTNSLIERKVMQKAEEENVSIILNNPTYRSQRCSSCGLVKQSQRKGKVYSCACGVKLDSDLNGSMNNEIALPEIPNWLRSSKLNKTGFYWKPTGFFSLAGEEIMSPSFTESSRNI